MDRCRDTYNISRTDRRGERRTKSLKTVDISAARILRSENQAQRLRQFEYLQKMQPDCKQDPCPYKKHQQRRPPYKIINFIQYR